MLKNILALTPVPTSKRSIAGKTIVLYLMYVWYAAPELPDSWRALL